MAVRRERDVVTEFLEIYSNFPCLWDTGSVQYKDRNKKIKAWEFLAKKLREIEPRAGVAHAKKKIENMRAYYKREEKKIKESRLRASETGDVYVPTLWYFNLLRPFFNSCKDEEYKTGVDTFASDKDTQTTRTEKTSGAIKKNANRGLDQKKRKLIRTAAPELEQRSVKKLNSFGVYVGEQLEQIHTLQRHVAEKLISDVLFLAKTGKLHYDTKIETPTRAPHLITKPNNSQSPSPQYIVPSPLSHSESSVSSPPHYIRLTLSPQSIRLPSPQYSDTPSPAYTSQKSTTEQDENAIQISTPDVNSPTLTKKKHPSTTMSTSYSSPAPVLKYILSTSHHIQPSSPRQSSSPQTTATRNANEENIQLASAESEASLHTIPTKENQTTTLQ